MEAHEIENSVIGSFLQDASRVAEVDLTIEDFVSTDCQAMFRAIKALINANRPVDAVTVGDLLTKKLGIASDISSWIAITGKVQMGAYSPNWKHHAVMIHDRAKARRAGKVAMAMLKRLEVSDTESIDTCIAELMQVSHTRGEDHECTMAEASNRAVVGLREAAERGDRLVGVDTGIADLNDEVGGWHKQDLIFIGARPGMGKTAMMCNGMARAGVPVGVISGEQGREQIGQRMLSIVGGVPVSRMRNADLQGEEWEDIDRAHTKVSALPIQLLDRGAPTIDDIVRAARRWTYRDGIKALYVDYIQRIKDPGAKDRTTEVSNCCVRLKELARELDIPVIALAQVNREVERRPDKRPTLSDFLHSGAIEAEGDLVIGLYRDEVYYGSESKYHAGVAELNLLKNRHGRVGRAYVLWRGECMRFESLQKGMPVTKMVKPKAKKGE